MDRSLRVLIVKFGAIGDVVMTVPAAHAMHQAGYQVDWVCGRQVLPLLERYSWIRPLAVDDRALLAGSARERARALTALWRMISGPRYTICITLYYDTRYKVVTLPVRAGKKLTLSRRDRSRQLLPGRHHTDEFLRIMQGRDDGPIPVPLSPVPPETLPPSPLPPSASKHRIVLVPGGAKNAIRSDALRRWPVESYVLVAQALLRSGRDVVLVGGPEDSWASAPFTGLPVTDLIGRLAIVDTVALMQASDVVVTHDTGPLHLAGITSAGIVSIFGPTDPRGRLPQRSGTVALWGGEGFSCRPCYDGREYAPCKDNTCVQQVTPEMVVNEVEELLRQQTAGALLPPRVIAPRSTVTARLVAAPAIP